mmetsp:Transcript_18862/g.65756  ORF Transcript_18862/g.65756 Transcript_18862/m.65756 type:complete len:339 (+) Transcript_18862:1566-2582(+)
MSRTSSAPSSPGPSLASSSVHCSAARSLARRAAWQRHLRRSFAVTACFSRTLARTVARHRCRAAAAVLDIRGLEAAAAPADTTAAPVAAAAGPTRPPPPLIDAGAAEGAEAVDEAAGDTSAAATLGAAPLAAGTLARRTLPDLPMQLIHPSWPVASRRTCNRLPVVPMPCTKTMHRVPAANSTIGALLKSSPTRIMALPIVNTKLPNGNAALGAATCHSSPDLATAATAELAEAGCCAPAAAAVAAAPASVGAEATAEGASAADAAAGKEIAAPAATVGGEGADADADADADCSGGRSCRVWLCTRAPAVSSGRDAMPCTPELSGHSYGRFVSRAGAH